MAERFESERQYQWIVYALATLIVGALAGYILANQGAPRAPAGGAPPAATAPSAPAAVVDEAELRAYRDILARDPKNVQAAVKAGNILYDAQRYAEAIPFYQQAFAANPSDISVSTDLGTALWYAGRPDEALAQYEKSLAINPTHQQTLFNMGIVKADGKHDYAGAVVLWQKLLKEHPDYPDAAHLKTLLADAQQKLPPAR